MKISLKQTRLVDKGDFKANFYIEKKEGKGFNALFVDCLTEHYTTKLTGAARAYLVIEGIGSFTINGRTETVEPYDLFLISDGDTYAYKGKMKLFEFNIPATDSGNEEELTK